MTASKGLTVAVVGGGGREHALVVALSKSPTVQTVLAVPGNAGGAPEDATATVKHLNWVPMRASSNFSDLVETCKAYNVDLVVVGPEQPLVDGMADALKRAGILVFGPSAAAARLEGSKAFAKAFMARWEIPSAPHFAFSTLDDAINHVASLPADARIVVKASGLAAGKGVLLPDTKEEAIAAVRRIMIDHAFGEAAGAEIVIEERLAGPEVSLLAFSDGYTVRVMPPAQDHKRALDGDRGANTGGMGAYAPTPLVSRAWITETTQTVLQRAVEGLRREGTPFVGVLYAGLMLDPQRGTQVLEFNVRFGDPETQVLLPLLKSDLAQILLACARGCLDAVPVEWADASAATVILAAPGYPDTYPRGLPLEICEPLPQGVAIYHGGTRRTPKGGLESCGGRVLAVTGTAATLKDAVARAYHAVDTHVTFPGAHLRRDIAAQALALPKLPAVTYADAGVSIDRGNELVERIRAHANATRRSGADGTLGLKGVFDLAAAGYPGKDTVLVSGTDGVGTKLKLAHATGRHETIGIDLVAMCVNDVLMQGAEPLFFLDYLATSRLCVDTAAAVVEGIAEGCRQSGCALIGGETAEMPGFYQGSEYDLAGFAVGAVRRSQLLPRPSAMRAGDFLVGIPSSGPHSNGYSLIRRVVSGKGLDLLDPCPWSPDQSLADALLVPTRLYAATLLPLLRAENSAGITALSHITGGGFVDNIPRVLPSSLAAKIYPSAWEMPAWVKWLHLNGPVSPAELVRTFNCGIGMVLVVSARYAPGVLAALPGSVAMGTLVERGPADEVVQMEGLLQAFNS